MSETTSGSQAQRNLATAEAIYAACATGDWDTVETMLSDELVIFEADTLPFAGEYKGKGALRELYGKVLSTLGGASIKTLGRTAGGNHVAYILELELPGSDDPISLVEVLQFGPDGKVVEIQPYYFNSDVVCKACETAG